MSQTSLHPPGLGPIVLGGAVGASVRWGLIELLPLGEPFWGLLVINGIGCLLIGWLRGAGPEPRPDRVVWSTGFCGGLTTFSTVSVESALLLDQGRAGMMASYLIACAVTGVALVAVGQHLRPAAS